MAYETTNVGVDRTQGDIRKLLVAFGAAEFQFGEGTGVDDRRWSGVTFRHGGHTVLIQVALKDPDAAELKRQSNVAQRARTRTKEEIGREYWDQEERRIWRVLYWSLKARMIAVEEGVEEFEQAFLAHLVDPRTGITLWQHVQPAIEQGAFRIGGSGLKAIGVSSMIPESEIIDAEIEDAEIE